MNLSVKKYHKGAFSLSVKWCELEEDESKLQALKEKLQAGEDSPKIENFNSNEFISNLHKKHIK